MLFDSFDFAIFLPIVFALYWSIERFGLRLQNAFLVLVSYIFYGWWDWKFFGLIILSSVVDYVIAKQIYNSNDDKNRKGLLLVSIFTNIGILTLFKYFNFFFN